MVNSFKFHIAIHCTWILKMINPCSVEQLGQHSVVPGTARAVRDTYTTKGVNVIAREDREFGSATDRNGYHGTSVSIPPLSMVPSMLGFGTECPCAQVYPWSTCSLVYAW